METCPFCSSSIPSSYLIEGGICDECGQLILGEDDLIEEIADELNIDEAFLIET